MKLKQLIIYPVVFIVLTIAACKKDNKDTITTTDPTTPVTPVAAKPYTVTENFENGTKTAYADANVTLATGVWDFNDALIGNLAADVKNGAEAVRLRTGSITTKFDISGVSQIKISHAKYGSDAASTWKLLISTDGGTTFTQVGNDISETSTTLVADSFKITPASKIRLQILKAGTTRINIDDIVFSGTGDPGIVVGTPDTGTTDTTSTSSAATARLVNIGTDAPPSTGDNSNLLMGNPSGAQTSLTFSNNYLIDQGYYVESYNSSRGEPNWVSWHLDATNTTNATGRLDNFAAWAGLPTGFYAVQSNSYSGSGFDRGHNCPSADRTSSTAANSATFLMTNMIPQAPQNNQQTWANLENYLRQQTVEGNEVYIIMGSYGTGGVGSVSSTTVSTINSGHVNVPSNVWKVAVIIPVGNSDIIRIGSTTRVIAVNTPNINSINSDWTKYIVTVRSIEQATGYNLLSALPQSVQDVIENAKDSGI
jgi:endonuclease G